MKLSIQTAGIIEGLGAEKCYKLIAQAGFEAVDWQAIERAIGMSWDQLVSGEWRDDCIYYKSFEECIAYFKEEYEIIKKNGLTVSQTHAPFPCWHPKRPELLEYMIGVYKRIIEVCRYYGVRYVVIHGIARSLDDHTVTDEYIESLNWHLYHSLIPTLKECPDVVVCLENLFTWDGGLCAGHCASEQEAARLIDKLNACAGRQAFGLCFDVGHLNVLRKDLRTYLHTLGNRVVALHIHDNDGNEDRHMAPLSGKIKWNHFCNSLKEIGYEGDLSLETFAQSRDVLLFDEELLLPWLTVMAKTIACFRKHILN